MDLKVEIFIYVFFFLGAFFSLIGVVGIIRGKDIFKRVQNSMIIYSLGVFPILIVLSVYNFYFRRTQAFIKIIIIIIVLFMIMPLLNSLLIKRSYYSNEKERKRIAVDEYGGDKND